jgi:hypothetical protein
MMPRMLGTYGGAALLLCASAIVGQAVFLLAGIEAPRRSGCAVGLSLLLVIATIAITLPGRATTAAVVCALITATCALAARHRLAEWLRPAGWVRPLAVVLPAVALASVPFLANRRLGLLGVSLNNDTAVHLLWAEGLGDRHLAALYPANSGYPLGPHSLFAALATLTGARLDHALLALMLATVAITALTAADLMRRSSVWRAAVTGVTVSGAYLVSAYYGQGAFKEPMMGLFLLAFVIALRDLRHDIWLAGGTARRWMRMAVPCGLLVAAAVQTYSYLAFAWLGGLVVVWLVIEVCASPSLVMSARRRGPWLVRAGTVSLAAVVVLLVTISPSLGRIVDYIGQVGSSSGGTGIAVSELGNLAAPLPVYEALGLWVSQDFRFVPVNAFHYGELVALGLVALVFGVAWALRRREFALVAAVGACALVYLYSHHRQSPYVSAKALVIAAPVVMLVILWGLLSTPARGQLAIFGVALRTVAGVAFACFALYCATLVLRGSPVWASEQMNELGKLRSLVGRADVLYLGNDDYAGWELRGARVGYLQTSSLPPPIAVARSSKPYVYGQPFDFDSVEARQLDRFAYVITTNTPFASQAPPNFKLVRSLGQYELWRRTGPTPARLNLDTGAAPGAVLNCATPVGLKLRRTRGTAALMPTPVTLTNIGTLQPNRNVSVGLPLPAGEWDLSLEYTSAERLKLSSGPSHWTLPPNLARPGPYFYFGSVHSDGRQPLQVGIYEDHPSHLTSPVAIASLSGLAATRRPDRRTLVPLASACGRFVDWYERPR